MWCLMTYAAGFTSSLALLVALARFSYWYDNRHFRRAGE